MSEKVLREALEKWSGFFSDQGHKSVLRQDMEVMICDLVEALAESTESGGECPACGSNYKDWRKDRCQNDWHSLSTTKESGGLVWAPTTGGDNRSYTLSPEGPDDEAIKAGYEDWCKPRMGNVEPDHPYYTFIAGAKWTKENK